MQLLRGRGAALLAISLLALGAPAGGARSQSSKEAPLVWITLGTQGGPVPSLERSEPANALLVRGRPWIVDCGDGTMERFAAAGFAQPQAITVFISHLHVDHIAGLQGLIALHWFREAPGATPVTVYGPPGTDRLVAGVVASLEPTAAIARAEQPEKWSPADSVKVVIVRDGADFLLEGVRVRAVRNSHFDDPPGRPQENGTQSLSYRFDLQGYGVGYTGDTGPSEAVVSLMKGADLLLSEVTLRGTAPGIGPGDFRDQAAAAAFSEQKASTPRRTPQGARARQAFHFTDQHLSPAAAGELAEKAGVKRLVFTHLAVRGPTADIAALIVQEARRAFRGEIVVAHDLARY